MRNKYRPPNSLMTKVALVRGEKRRDHEITRRTDFGVIPGKDISYRLTAPSGSSFHRRRNVSGSAG